MPSRTAIFSRLNFFSLRSLVKPRIGVLRRERVIAVRLPLFSHLCPARLPILLSSDHRGAGQSTKRSRRTNGQKERTSSVINMITTVLFLADSGDRGAHLRPLQVPSNQ